MPRLFATLTMVFLLCQSMQGHSQPTSASHPLAIASHEASWGHRNGAVTLINYLDLQSSSSERTFAQLQTLKKTFGKQRLRLVFRHAPASYHVHAKRLALAAQAAYQLRGIRGFEAFVAAAFAERAGKRTLRRGSDPLDSVLKRLGWPKKHIVRRMQQGALKRRVQAQAKRAQGLSNQPASTLFLNGLRLNGPVELVSLKRTIHAQLAKAQALRAKGVARSSIYDRLVRLQFKAPKQAKPKKTAVAARQEPIWKIVDIQGAPSRGARSPLVTMVVFSDLQCPYCKRADQVHKRLLKRYPKELRIVFKHFPLGFHQQAKAAHNFAMAAFKLRGHRGFWQAQEALLDQPRRLHDADLVLLTQRLSLPTQRVMRMVRNERFAKRIAKDKALGADFGVRGTPHQFINGRSLSGARSEEDFASIIDEEIVKARKLLRRGVPRSRLYATLLKDGLGPKEPPRKKVAPPTPQTPSRGPRKARVVIQMFSDFQCPFCARVMPTLEKVLRNYPKQVRLVFRHRPLSFHRNAPAAHATALEAFRQGGNAGFWRMYQVLQANPRALEKNDLLRYAQSQGLNTQQLRRAWQNGHHNGAIKADVDIAEAAGIQGTPAFVINDYYLAGAQPYRKFKRLIDKALRRKKPKSKP